MKMLEPTISCIVTTHMKPTLREALGSLVSQTRLNDLQIIVIDSGAWIDKNDEISMEMGKIYMFKHYPNIEWYFTGEPKNARELYCPVSHWENYAIRHLVRGKFICTFYDDDIYYPTFMEQMAGYLEANPDAMGVRCTENRTELRPDGTKVTTPSLVADRDILQGENMDCVVDGMQVMLRREVYDRIGDPWYPEDPDWNSCSHSDGIFFNKVSQVINRMGHIEEALCEHRNTVYSTFTPTT